MKPFTFFSVSRFIGKYVIHCHNVLHEDHAMMVLFEIDDVGDTKTNPYNSRYRRKKYVKDKQKKLSLGARAMRQSRPESKFRRSNQHRQVIYS